MSTSTTFLRSKVARRIVLLFFSCALLPVTILAIVSYYQVSWQLRDESQKQLTHLTKGQGMAIYERLEMLDSDLRLMSSQLGEEVPKGIADIGKTHFDGVAIFGSDGSRRAAWGSAPCLPQLAPVEQRHLSSDKSLLKIIDGCIDGCVYMVRLAKPGNSTSDVLVGKPSSDFLWAEKNLLPGFDFCVVTAVHSVMFCSDASVRSHVIPVSANSSGLFEFIGDGVTHDAAYWKLMTRPMFLQDPWTIVVSQKHTDGLGVMMRFRASFPLLILLSLWIVLLFSLIQIRRTLGPLEELQRGTNEIGAGKFGARVSVHSGDEFENLASSFNAMGAKLGKQFHMLKAINEIDQAIFASLNREGIVDGVLAHMPNLFPADSFGVCLVDDGKSSMWTRICHADTGLVHTVTSPITGTGWQQLQNIASEFAIVEHQELPDYLAPFCSLGMRSYLVLPVRVEKSTEAVLVCANRKPDVLELEHVPEARQVTEQLAVAFSHVRLIKALEQLHWGTLTALARAIDAKSEWTSGHSERVTQVAVDIGRNMGMSQSDLRIMQMGGLLHDIGKIGTPPKILDKPGALTDDEMCIMREHVRTGLRILEPIPGLHDALPIVSQHHEWFNGNGYPAGLAGKEISLYARIFAIADCYDALSSDRPYRKGLPLQRVLSMLQERSGTQFDPEIIEVFMRMMATKEPDAEAAEAQSFVAVR